MLALLKTLTPNQQEVVRLKFQNGFSYREISAITGLSESNVGYLLHIAIRKIRERLAAFATESEVRGEVPSGSNSRQ